MSIVNQIRKSIASGVAAGAASYASGADWRVAIAAGIGAAALVWSIPNAVQ